MKKLLLIPSVCLWLASCNARKDIVYLQNNKVDQVAAIANQYTIRIEPGDQLQIVVSCKDPELSAILNMPLVSFQTSTSTVNSTNSIITYTVNSDGTIDFPIIGSIKVGGLTREEARTLIAEKIKESELIQDFVVTVNYANLKIYITGEVNSPGAYSITDNNVNVLQAISMARDLTIHGRRDEVFVIREQQQQRVSYRLDLRSDSIFQSPAFYLKQNDVIYVAPSRMRSNQSTVSGNNFQNVSFWVSVASTIASVSLAIMTYNLNKSKEDRQAAESKSK
ncbi:MAG: polysaccharide export protein [Paludibacteraceae bacterium]|nr:polysaccharide export protein [Paludibacteraceae bacterium]